MDCRVYYLVKPTIKGSFFESSSEDIPGRVLDVLSPDEGKNRVI